MRVSPLCWSRPLWCILYWANWLIGPTPLQSTLSANCPSRCDVDALVLMILGHEKWGGKWSYVGEYIRSDWIVWQKPLTSKYRTGWISQVKISEHNVARQDSQIGFKWHRVKWQGVSSAVQQYGQSSSFTRGASQYRRSPSGSWSWANLKCCTRYCGPRRV